MLRLNKHRQDNTRQTGHTSDNKHVHSDTGTDWIKDTATIRQVLIP